jgi:hypothetical protein
MFFDLEIAIGVQRMESRDLSVVIDGITSMLAPAVVQGQARLHIDVQPVADSYDAAEPKAA